MDLLTASAASGLRARMESLDMLANNLANVSTTGYKADREFYSLYSALDASADPADGAQPVIEKQWTDLSQGVLESTGHPLDLALNGRGFFTVKGPRGTLLTRNGNFQISRAGEVTTAEGNPVLLKGGATLKVNPNEPIAVSPDGSITQGGQTLGQLDLVDVPSPGALAKQGTGFFSLNDAAIRLAAAQAEVRQGQLETSNVNSPESAVRLISILRQFETLQKAVTLGTEMNKQAIQEVARVGS